MKNTSLLFALLFPILGFAQSPTPSPRPVAGFIAGIQAPGTTIWSKPLTWVPAVPAGSKIVFIPGATVPTLGAVQLALAKKMAVQCLTDAYGKALSAGITVTTGALTT